MAGAQGDQIVQLGLAAVGPVLDVMALDEAGGGAVGEAAAAVAGVQCSFQGRRDGAGAPADIQRLAVAVLDQAHQG